MRFSAETIGVMPTPADSSTIGCVDFGVRQ
jgi:hypothetical protein